MPAIDLPAAEPPLYQLIQPRSAQVLGPAWARSFPEHSEVVGYSSLGHVFMRKPASREYLVLHPLKGAAKSYGSYRSLAAFERGVLQDPGFAAFVLRPDHVRVVARRLGPLAEDSVYIPTPYPFLGGRQAQFLQNIIQTVHQFGAIADQTVAALGLRRMNRPRHGKHIAAIFRRQPAGNQRATFQAGFHHQTPLTEPGYQAIAARKMLRQRRCAQRKFRQDQTGLRQLARQRLIARRVNPVNAGADHRHAGCRRAQGAGVGGGVDAGGHAADNGQPGLPQRLGPAFCGLRPLHTGVAAAHHGQHRPLQ